MTIITLIFLHPFLSAFNASYGLDAPFDFSIPSKSHIITQLQQLTSILLFVLPVCAIL